MFLVLPCSCLCPIYWIQVLSREWRCSWSSADRRCSSYIWVITIVIAYQSMAYIRGLTVSPKWYQHVTFDLIICKSLISYKIFLPCCTFSNAVWRYNFICRLNIKMSSYQYRDPMLKIRQSPDRLIFNMGIPIPEKTIFILRRGPGYHILLWVLPLPLCSISVSIRQASYSVELLTHKPCVLRKL